jgi:UDP-3-O-[3-hydroxymyristoyl] glucosamine N-acyltransferase
MRLLIIGAGGLATEIYDWFLSDELRIFKASQNADQLSLVEKKYITGVHHLVESKYLNQHDESLVPETLESFFFQDADRFVIAINDVFERRRIAIKLHTEKAAKFATICHTSASVSKQCHLSLGCIIGAFVRINPNVHLAENVILNNFCSLGNRASVGLYSSLASHVDIHDSAKVGSQTFIGSHSIVAAKKHVGERCIIGANCFISRDLRSDSVILSQKPLQSRRI